MKKWHFNGKEMDFRTPRIMGIINLTDDSFYRGSRHSGPESAVLAAGEMINEGAYILDLGAVSTRPGAPVISEQEELSRLLPALASVRSAYPRVIISIDTYRSRVAETVLDAGADMINDISAGLFDDKMAGVILRHGAPYVLMHIQGTPETMQADPRYENVVEEVYAFLAERVDFLQSHGHNKMIIDPGFGFGKTTTHNFILLDRLERFRATGFPVMAGISRKSMINRVIGTKPSEALNGTTVLNTIALMNGADILRVHDVKPALEAITLTSALREARG